MQAISCSHIGRVRKNNEDAVLCLLDKGIFAVADGIGGQDNGEIAAAAAVAAVEKLKNISLNKDVSKAKKSQDIDIASLLRESFYAANDLIYSVGSGKPGGNGMGTTMTAAWINDNRIFIAHVGDSRAYLINESGVSLLSEDHSLVGELIRSGKLSLNQARSHPKRNILTRSLGQTPMVEVYENQTPFRPGDYLLICSDGLYNPIAEDELFAVIHSSADISTVSKVMLEMALSRGGADNISFVLISCS